MSHVLGTADDDVRAWEKKAAQIEKELQQKNA
jgi:hypothetical protein